jgi:hypothetical protein
MRLDAIGPVGLRAEATALEVPILPKAAVHATEIHVVMPHHIEYDALPGEDATAPSRVHAHPRRFTRRDGRWVPS